MSDENPFKGFVPSHPKNEIAASLPPRKSKVVDIDDTVIQYGAQVRANVRDKLAALAEKDEVSMQDKFTELVLAKHPPASTPDIPEAVLVQLSVRIRRRVKKKLAADAKASGMTAKAYIEWLIWQA